MYRFDIGSVSSFGDVAMVGASERNRFTVSTKAKTNWEKKHIPGTETKNETNTYESESRWILHN